MNGRFLTLILQVVFFALSPVSEKRGLAQAERGTSEDVPVPVFLTLRLSPADVQEQSAKPYCQAKLSIANNSSRVFERVSLRWLRGGPEFIHPITVSPHSTASIRVNLPAVDLHQTYMVTLSGQRDSENISAVARIEWKPRQLATDTFINPEAYDRHRCDIHPWPRRTKVNIFISAVIYSLSLAGCLFIRRRAWRVTAIIVLAISATVVLPLLLPKADQIIVQRRIRIDGSNTATAGTLIVLASRRTCQWTNPNHRLAPIYFSPAQLANDTMTIHARNGVKLTLKPGQIRLLLEPDKP